MFPDHWQRILASIPRISTKSDSWLKVWAKKTAWVDEFVYSYSTPTYCELVALLSLYVHGTVLPNSIGALKDVRIRAARTIRVPMSRPRHVEGARADEF